MAWTIYTGTITGQAGSLTTMLDTNLVAAGWSIAFTGTNKRAYRNGAGALARRYFRVRDDTLPTGGAKEAYIQGFNTMSDVDTGTGEFPTAVQTGAYGGAQIIRKSNTADATPRSYILAADDKTFILFIAAGDAFGDYYTTYAGDFFSYVPGDTNASALLSRTTENLANASAETVWRIEDIAVNTSANPTVAPFGHYLGGSHSGAAGSVQFGKLALPWCNWAGATTADSIGGHIVMPSPVDGGLWLSPLFVFTAAGGWVVRGKLRGIYLLGHPATGVSNGDTFSGAGELAGKAFRIVKRVVGYISAGSTSQSGAGVLETSTPDSST